MDSQEVNIPINSSYVGSFGASMETAAAWFIKYLLFITLFFGSGFTYCMEPQQQAHQQKEIYTDFAESFFARIIKAPESDIPGTPYYRCVGNLVEILGTFDEIFHGKITEKLPLLPVYRYLLLNSPRTGKIYVGQVYKCGIQTKRLCCFHESWLHKFPAPASHHE